MQRGTGRAGRALAAAQVMADRAAHKHVKHDDGKDLDIQTSAVLNTTLAGNRQGQPCMACNL